MWVEPQQRRKGIGSELLDAIISWALERGLERLQLEVTETNSAAQALYIRARFLPTGRKRPLPSHPELQAIEMERSLKQR
jgi:[ribosomal protein S18]-alanine N-acetyltransferase